MRAKPKPRRAPRFRVRAVLWGDNADLPRSILAIVEYGRAVSAEDVEAAKDALSRMAAAYGPAVAAVEFETKHGAG